MHVGRRSASKLRRLGVRAYARISLAAYRRRTEALYAAGALLLLGGLADLSHAKSAPTYQEWDVRLAVGLLFQLIEGAFGALIMTVSGLAAIIAASMGAYRAALGMLVVAVGAFILRALVSLFFGSYPTISGGYAGGGYNYSGPDWGGVNVGGNVGGINVGGSVGPGGWGIGGMYSGSGGSVGGTIGSGGWSIGGQHTGSSGGFGMGVGSSGGNTNISFGGGLSGH